MRRMVTGFLALFMVIGIFSAGCMTEPEGPVGEPTAEEQNSAAAAAVVLSAIINEDGENLTSFTWNLFSDTFYSDGWWHTSFTFTLSSGDNGTLSINANFQDADGNDQFLPGALTTRMETNVAFDGTFWTFPTDLNAEIVLTRDPGGKVLTINGSGTLSFSTMYLTLAIDDLIVDLDILYPVGIVTAHMSDEHLGEWDIIITFDGTNLVDIKMDNGVSIFTFTLDLSTGQIS